MKATEARPAALCEFLEMVGLRGLCNEGVALSVVYRSVNIGEFEGFVKRQGYRLYQRGSLLRLEAIPANPNL